MGYWDERADMALQRSRQALGKKEVGKPTSNRGAQRLRGNLATIYCQTTQPIIIGHLKKILKS